MDCGDVLCEQFGIHYLFLDLWDHGSYAAHLKKSSAYAPGASVVWHTSFPLINSFNKTEGAIFPHARYVSFVDVPLFSDQNGIRCDKQLSQPCL